MAEPHASSSAPDPQSLCGECRSDPWKYRCPGCSARTCSLPCVKSHKLRTGCTGQKPRSEVVPLAKFDDNLLLSDYNFLEEAKRVAESARRRRCAIGGTGWYELQALKRAAHWRRTHVLFLPAGMSRRQNNRSRFEKRNNSIFWTVEWRFYSTDVVLVDHGVNEHLSIQSVIEKHLMPGPWNHQLRPFCNEQIDNLKFFLRKNKGSRPIFRQLKARDPIGLQMHDILIVEYPVIHVCLPTSRCGFEVEKSTNSASVYRKPSPNHECTTSLKGRVFREEEIDDDGSSETVVVDLMHCTKPAVLVDSGHAKEAETTREIPIIIDRAPKRSTEAPESFLDNKRRETGEGTHNTYCDFDFEQDLKDAYSDLVREANPDEFLCFDYVSEGEKLETWQGNPLIFHDPSEAMWLEDEELEEGEIPS